MKKARGIFSVIVILLVSISAVCLLGAVAIKKKPMQSRPSYVEISGSEITYVPQTSSYVKIDGKLTRIVRFEPYRQQAETDCRCPKCCNGICYIIVYSDAVILNQPIRLLYFLWLDC